ncbi:transketolase [Persicitalea jodogahamensis]|uniref:Transketolase n=1 Tax=Persicitalea jodogahamensis TaxID=402147 RepID=A0A8J3G7V8_9BACT|nr:transketolase [Persicitalea jodogahamensis]GHB59557.1 transketolase [Persicitalea jodogahamensis]
MEIKELEKIASQVRRDIVRMVHACQSGHPGGSLGCTELLVALYFDQMHLKEQDGEVVFDMNGEGEDLFFLSNGHISPVWYSVLARKGYFPVKELATFRDIDSRLQGHPTTHEGLPGIRIASGSLGQGNSVAMGAALAKRLNKDDHMVYVLMGDGEQQEGQVWEAATFAPHHQIGHLIAFIDLNGQQIDGPTVEVMNNRDLGKKYEAFGWEVMTITQGNDMAEVVKGITEARSKAGHGKPVMVLLETGMGYGVDFMMGSHKWHGVAPNDEQLKVALDQLEETMGDY